MMKIRFGLVAAVVTLTPVFPSSGAADFLGPPRFAAKRDAFIAMASACNGSLDGSTQDTTFWVSATAFFYQSATLCEHAEGADYCATYLVSTSTPNQCLGTFYARGEPLYGSVLGALPAGATESVILHVPGGKIQIVEDDGEVQVLDYAN